MAASKTTEISPSLSLLSLFALMQLMASTATAQAIDYTCPAPVSLGGLGYCGPTQCSQAQTSKPKCVYTGASINYAQRVSSQTCRQCTQRATSMCTTSALTSLIVGTGVKAAFCTDTHLVLYTDGSSTWSNTYLDSIPNPPGSVQPDGVTACVTGSQSVTPSFLTFKIPLDFTLLGTASALNNIGAFPDGASDSSAGYMSSSSGTYGLPTRGDVGITVSGQDIFPTFNNRAELTDESCETDSCNEHVGGGGGQPHLHGDPFGSFCLYSAANYSSTTVHPPQIGWSRDGPSIYGRYLHATSLGYTNPLDLCGGHAHDNLPYHYHTQVFETTTTRPVRPLATGLPYTYSTVGPHQCWRADISKIVDFFGTPNSIYNRPCCGMNNYYVASGISINRAGAQNKSAAAPSPSPPSQSPPSPHLAPPSPPSPRPRPSPPITRPSPPTPLPPPSLKKAPPSPPPSPSPKKSPPPRPKKSPPPRPKKSPPPPKASSISSPPMRSSPTPSPAAGPSPPPLLIATNLSPASSDPPPDQPPKPADNTLQPPRPVNNVLQPPRSSDNGLQPPKPADNTLQPPRPLNNVLQPPRSSDNGPQPPRPSKNGRSRKILK